MRNFKIILRRVGIFLLCVILLSLLFAELYFRGENYDYQDARERDALAGKVTLLTSGASYVLFGVVPDLLDEALSVTSYNIAGTLMTVQGRSALLEQELARNPVETVLLEVSPDTLTRCRAKEGPEGDLPMLGRFSTAGARWAYFRDAFSLSEYPMVYYDVVTRGMESGWRLLTGSYRKTNREITRGYYYNRKQDAGVLDNYAELYQMYNHPEEILAENVEALDGLVDLCRSHGARVILISLPQSKSYNCMYGNLDVFQTWYEDYAAARNLPYFNFNLAREKLKQLPDDGCYYDETHLNRRGSEVFTRMLADTLGDYLNGEETADRFYASYEELNLHSGYFD